MLRVLRPFSAKKRTTSRPNVPVLLQKLHQFDFAVASPAEQLAADEALLAAAERNESFSGAFRVWESTTPFVVLGRGSKVAEEVNQDRCREDHVSILRRTSGGATILTGPGCLMYTVVLRHEGDSRLATIDATHDFVLNTTCEALNASPLLGDIPCRVEKAGTSDLALREGTDQQSAERRKVSGNAMRRARNWTLYHGTLLYDFDLALVGRYLATAPRQPDYRAARDHTQFVTNLPLSREAITQALLAAWNPHPPEAPSSAMLGEIQTLVDEKYSLDGWNLRH